MKWLIALVFCLTNLASAPAAPPTKARLTPAQEQGLAVLQAAKDAAVAITQVKDKPTAEKVKPKLAEMAKLVKDYTAKEAELSEEDKKWFEAEFEPKYGDARAELERVKDQLVEKDEKLYGLIGNAQVFRKVKVADVKRAEMNAQSLQKACKAYYLVYNRKWPGKLIELAVPGEGKRPLVDGGKNSVRDPWGRAYKFIVEKDLQTGDEIPVISTLDPFGDGKQEIRWPEKK